MSAYRIAVVVCALLSIVCMYLIWNIQLQKRRVYVLQHLLIMEANIQSRKVTPDILHGCESYHVITPRITKATSKYFLRSVK